MNSSRPYFLRAIREWISDNQLTPHLMVDAMQPGIIHSPYFSHAQDDTSLRFYQLHHFLKPTSSDGGLIAFPSFHVIWAILLTYLFYDKKILFYLAALFNLLVIASTVFLGWHYVVDVIGGAILAIAGIMFAEWIYKKSFI